MASSFPRGADGFAVEMTGAEARRQLRLSIGVVGVIAVGIASAAAAIGSNPVPVKRHVAWTAPAAALRAGGDAVGPM